jgi:hypothetical protein
MPAQAPHPSSQNKKWIPDNRCAISGMTLILFVKSAMNGR